MSIPTVIWILKIKHEYFQNDSCRGFVVTPLKRMRTIKQINKLEAIEPIFERVSCTQTLLKRRNMLFKEYKDGEWRLYDMGDNGHIQGDDIYEFDVRLSKKRLMYLTKPSILIPGNPIIVEIEQSEKDIQLIDESNRIEENSDIVIRIQLKLKENAIYKTVINIQATQMFWEYLFLLRNPEVEKQLVLEELEGKCSFSQAERLEYYGHPAIRFISKEKIGLCELYPYRFQLSEIIRERKRMIIDNVSYPEPGMFPDTPPDVVRSVIYI